MTPPEGAVPGDGAQKPSAAVIRQRLDEHDADARSWLETVTPRDVRHLLDELDARNASCLKHEGHEHCVTPCDSIRIQEANHNAYLTAKDRADDLESELTLVRAALQTVVARWTTPGEPDFSELDLSMAKDALSRPARATNDRAALEAVFQAAWNLNHGKHDGHDGKAEVALAESVAKVKAIRGGKP